MTGASTFTIGEAADGLFFGGQGSGLAAYSGGTSSSTTSFGGADALA